MKSKPTYLLSPAAVQNLRDQKEWSIKQWGYEQTKKYFDILTKGFDYITENYKRFPARKELTGDTDFLIYLIRENYVVFQPMKDGRIFIHGILGQDQDIPNILRRSQRLYQQERSKAGKYG